MNSITSAHGSGGTPAQLAPKSAARDERTCVYLLRVSDWSRFKVGHSRHPVERIQRFNEMTAPGLDLEHSFTVWVESPSRARDLERMLHRCLAPWRLKDVDPGDGFTEWFSGDAMVTAIELVSRWSKSCVPGLRMSVAGFTEAPTDIGRDETACATLEEAWSRTEDVWLRSSHCTRVQVVPQGDRIVLIIEGVRNGFAKHFPHLRRALLDADTYTAVIEGRRCGIVETISFEGDNLALLLQHKAHFQRIPGGLSIHAQMTATVAFLATRSAPAVALSLKPRQAGFHSSGRGPRRQHQDLGDFP